MEEDASWLDASTYPETMRDMELDEKTRQTSQEVTVDEHEEARRELFCPQQPFRWQATTEVEMLTEGPTLQWASRMSELGDSSEPR